MADTIQHSENNRPVSGTTVVPEAPPPQNANANGAKRGGLLHFDGLQINLFYFRTVPGILKAIEWVIGIICIACSSPPYFDAVHWFLFVAVFCFIFTFIWACIHFFSITTVINIPWLLIEIGYTALAMLFYFIAFIVLLVETSKHKSQMLYSPYAFAYTSSYINYDSYLTAGSFGIFNFIAYAVETMWHAKTFLDSRQQANRT